MSYNYNQSGVTYNGNSSYNGTPITIAIVTTLGLAVNSALTYDQSGYTYNSNIPYNGSTNTITVIISDTGSASTQVLSTILNSPTISAIRNVTVTPQGILISAILNSPVVVALQNFNISIKPSFFIKSIQPNSFVLSTVPRSQLAKVTTPHAISAKTGASIYDNGLTYNQSGYTYNDVLGSYGGFYGLQTVFPASGNIRKVVPTNI